jgi:hypothetical protein
VTALDVLTAEGASVVARCEVWLGGDMVEEPPVLDGRVMYDSSARVARACTVTLLGDLPLLPSDPLSPVGSTLRLFRGARDWTGTVYEEPLGWYAFDETTVRRISHGIEVAGYGFSQLVSDARWEQPYHITSGTNLATAIALAVESRLAPVNWLEPNLESTARTAPDIVWGEERDNDPWEDVSNLADAAGMDVYFARDGRFTLMAVPDPLGAEPTWTLQAGVSPLYLDGERTLTGRPYNVVVVRGEADDDSVPVEQTVEDDDPASPSYIGNYRRPYFMTSAYITTDEQAYNAGVAQLRRTQGLSEQVTLAMVPHPALDIWQVIEAYDEDLGVDARYLIDKVTLPLTPGEATITARRRRLA